MIEYIKRRLYNLEIIYSKNYIIKKLYKKKLYYKIIICLIDFMINKLYNKKTKL